MQFSFVLFCFRPSLVCFHELVKIQLVWLLLYGIEKALICGKIEGTSRGRQRKLYIDSLNIFATKQQQMTNTELNVNACTRSDTCRRMASSNFHGDDCHLKIFNTEASSSPWLFCTQNAFRPRFLLKLTIKMHSPKKLFRIATAYIFPTKTPSIAASSAIPSLSDKI